MTQITIEIIVNKNIEIVWKKWTDPDSIVEWNHASSDWHCPKAFNDLKVGGVFSFIMSAKDNSASFDFNGTYTNIIPNKTIKYTIQGGRKVEVAFEVINNNHTRVIETFDMETENSQERQREGWYAILKNFKQYCEKD
jgi:uncharacterized protein YndB with AHSA1/START domain